MPAATPIHRRQLLAGLGAVGTGLVVAACSGDSGNGSDERADATTTTTTAAAFDDATTCALTTELTEGPYYIDMDTIRRDIREDRPGQLLHVDLRVLDQQCAPIRDALVEIWHCDAVGTYSGFEAQSNGGPGGPGGPGGNTQVDSTRYLRGGQVTDRNGTVEFTTIYPGWYRGRTVHIHAKVHVSNRERLTTQVFFDEDVTTEVYRQEPYASDTGRDTFNRDDSIFDDRLVLTTSKAADGYRGLMTFTVA